MIEPHLLKGEKTKRPTSYPHCIRNTPNMQTYDQKWQLNRALVIRYSVGENKMEFQEKSESDIN